MSENTTIMVKKRHKEVFEQTLDAVAEEIGEEPTQSQALRELAEAYAGHNGCGRWRYQ